MLTSTETWLDVPGARERAKWEKGSNTWQVPFVPANAALLIGDTTLPRPGPLQSDWVRRGVRHGGNPFRRAVLGATLGQGATAAAKAPQRSQSEPLPKSPQSQQAKPTTSPKVRPSLSPKAKLASPKAKPAASPKGKPVASPKAAPVPSPKVTLTPSPKAARAPSPKATAAPSPKAAAAPSAKAAAAPPAKAGAAPSPKATPAPSPLAKETDEAPAKLLDPGASGAPVEERPISAQRRSGVSGQSRENPRPWDPSRYQGNDPIGAIAAEAVVETSQKRPYSATRRSGISGESRDGPRLRATSPDLRSGHPASPVPRSRLMRVARQSGLGGTSPDLRAGRVSTARSRPPGRGSTSPAGLRSVRAGPRSGPAAAEATSPAHVSFPKEFPSAEDFVVRRAAAALESSVGTGPESPKGDGAEGSRRKAWVKLEGPFGETAKVRVKVRLLVQDLRRAVASKTAVPLKDLLLRIGDRVLEDARTRAFDGVDAHEVVVTWWRGDRLQAVMDRCGLEDVLATGWLGRTLLHYLVLDGDFGLCKEVCNRDYAPKLLNVQDVLGDTALMFASICGYDDIVELLMDRQAEPDHMNLAGRTALMLAAEHGQHKAEKTLLNADARRGPNPGFVFPDEVYLAELNGRSSVLTSIKHYEVSKAAVEEVADL